MLSPRDSIRSHRLRAQSTTLPSLRLCFRYQLQVPGCHLYFWLATINPCPSDPFLRFDHLIKQLLAVFAYIVGETVTFIGLLYNKEYIKNTNEQADEEICKLRLKNAPKAILCAGASVATELGVPVSQHVVVFTNPEVLCTMYLGFFSGSFII